MQLLTTDIRVYIYVATHSNILYAGGGSTLVYAQNMMAGLHAIITHMKIHFGLEKVRLLDVPCGDMEWMSYFLGTRDDVIYTGIDIVPDLIEHHRKTYAGRPWTFRNTDIVTDSTFVNDFDLILSRMMMQHLDHAAIFTILKKLSHKTRQPSFLLATTFNSAPSNVDLRPNLRGRFRTVNLELAPFRLEPPLCLFLDGPNYRLLHYMGLWRLPLMTIPQTNCDQSKPAKFSTQLNAAKFYSCISWKLPDISRNI